MFGSLSINYNKKSTRSDSPTFSSFNSSTVSASPSSQLSTISPENLSLKQKVNQIAKLNLNQHDINICACEDCIYRKQLNRKRKINLGLSMNSSYKHDYDPSTIKKAISKEKSINYEEMNRKNLNKSIAVDISSVYGNQYPKSKEQQKIIKHHPEDLLKFKGVIQNYSSNMEQYPSYKNNANPYVKPQQVHVENKAKLNARSIYQSNFVSMLKKPEETGKNPDQIKVGKHWVGNSSTYNQLFQQHSKNPEVIRQDKSRQKRQIQPKFVHQFQTSYKHQYMTDKKQVCKKKNHIDSEPSRLLQSLSTIS